MEYSANYHSLFSCSDFCIWAGIESRRRKDFWKSRLPTFFSLFAHHHGAERAQCTLLKDHNAFAANWTEMDRIFNKADN